MFSVIYYQLFQTQLFQLSRYFELIVLSLHLKSTPLNTSNLSKTEYVHKSTAANVLHFIYNKLALCNCMTAMMEMKMTNKKKLPSDQWRVRSVKQSRLLFAVEATKMQWQTSQLSFIIDKSIRKKQKQQNIQRFFNATASVDLSDIITTVFLINQCLSPYYTVVY